VDDYWSWGIQEMKGAGKTKLTMVIRRMFLLIARRKRTAIRRMQTKLG